MMAHGKTRECGVTDACLMMARSARQVMRKQHAAMSHRVDVQRRFITADRILIARKAARAPQRDVCNGVGDVMMHDNFGGAFLSQIDFYFFSIGPFHEKYIRCWTVNYV